MLLAGDMQRYRARTSSDQNVSSHKLLALNDNHIPTSEAGNSVNGVNAVFSKIPFQVTRHSIGEAAFKRHQVAPINPRLAFDAMPAYTHLRVDRLRTVDQHSLRIAAAEGTSPAEGTVIYQRYRPPCSTHSRARRLRGSAGADDHEIVGFHEVVPSKSKSKDGQDGRVNSIIPSNRPATTTHTPRSPQSN